MPLTHAAKQKERLETNTSSVLVASQCRLRTFLVVCFTFARHLVY
jgi:hypothetical protein